MPPVNGCRYGSVAVSLPQIASAAADLRMIIIEKTLPREDFLETTLSFATRTRLSSLIAKFPGCHPGPAPKGAGEIALVGKPQHECHLGLGIVV